MALVFRKKKVFYIHQRGTAAQKHLFYVLIISKCQATLWNLPTENGCF